MITQSEKSRIKALLQSPDWKIIQNIAEEYIKGLQWQSNLRETEWETAKNVALEEGQIQGIRGLIQELFKLAQNA